MAGHKWMVTRSLAGCAPQQVLYTLHAGYVHIRRFFRTASREECTIEMIGGMYRKISMKLLLKINKMYQTLTFAVSN